MEIGKFDDNYDEPYIKYYDEAISYYEINPGAQKTIILIHGLGVEKASWRLQFDPLYEAGYRVIALDVPGFGKSRYPDSNWRLASVSQRIGEMAASLCNHGQFTVMGISMGGVIALRVALDFSKYLDKLILVNSFACLRPDTLNGWWYLLKRWVMVSTRGKDEQAKMVAERLFPAAEQRDLRAIFMEQVQQADSRVYKTVLRELALVDLRKDLAKIHVPTLVISGEKDSTVPLRSQKDLVERIPGARWEVIPGAGHAVIVDHPQEFNRVMLAYLSEV